MRRRGWVIIDVTWAMIIMSLLAGVLAVGAQTEQSNLRRLAESRAASRAAEAALISMQCGRYQPSADVTVRALSEPTNVPGMTWVQVRATFNGRSSVLVGMAPQKIVARATGGTP
jgi:type II secretory pathway pseudopilin PulG